MAIQAQRIVVRIGMSAEIPPLQIGEMGWDIDKRRLRVGDGTTTPPMLMTDKSVGPFKFDFIDYVEFPQINMLPDGTVDGVDISDLNQTNGYLVRRGNNLWASRTFINDDGYVKIVNPDGVFGNTIIDFSDQFKSDLSQFLTSVAVDDITIHGNGRPESPLYAQPATKDLRGVAEAATVQETIDGVDDVRFVTPADLQAKKANQVQFGIVRFATPGEAAGGSDGVVATPGDIKRYVDAHATGYYGINVVQQDTFTTNLGKIYNTADFTYPLFLRVIPIRNAQVYAGSGGSGGSGGPGGQGPTNVGVLIGGPTGSDTPWKDFTVINGTLYGVDGYSMNSIQGVGATLAFYFIGTSFSADGVNLSTGGRAQRYTRIPFAVPS